MSARTCVASVVFVTSALIATLGACGGGGSSGGGNDGGGVTGPPPPPPPPHTVVASPSLAFTPASLSVNAGEVVTFSFGSVAHNVFFDAQTGAPTDIDGTNANRSVQRTFTTPGTYHYTCHIHPSMHGAVVVQ